MIIIFSQLILTVFFFSAEFITIGCGENNSLIMRIIIDEMMHVIFYAVIAFPFLMHIEFLCGIAAAVLIDIDHFISAHSFDPQKTLNLDNRPFTHSLLFALIITGISLLTGNMLLGFLVFIGLISHLMRDLITDTTPLFYPFFRRCHISFNLFVILGSILAGIVLAIYRIFNNISI